MHPDFTPFASLIGGGLIGLSAVLLLYTTGRIAGISGIVARLLPPISPDGRVMSLTFIAGLLAALPLYVLITGSAPKMELVAGGPTLIIAGLLVGFGAMIGSGCTSGHGVCGISRLSPRSIIATLTFMATGAITVFVLRHLMTGG